MLHGTHSAVLRDRVTLAGGLRGAMGVLKDAEGGWGGELSHTGEVGVMACSVCEEGYYKDKNACTPCTSPCATCSGTGQNACKSVNLNTKSRE